MFTYWLLSYSSPQTPDPKPPEVNGVSSAGREPCPAADSTAAPSISKPGAATVRRNESAPTFYQLMQPHHSPHLTVRSRSTVKRNGSLYNRTRLSRDKMSPGGGSKSDGVGGADEYANLLAPPSDSPTANHVNAIDIDNNGDLHDITVVAPRSTVPSVTEEDELPV